MKRVAVLLFVLAAAALLVAIWTTPLKAVTLTSTAHPRFLLRADSVAVIRARITSQGWYADYYNAFTVPLVNPPYARVSRSFPDGSFSVPWLEAMCLLRKISQTTAFDDAIVYRTRHHWTAAEQDNGWGRGDPFDTVFDWANDLLPTTLADSLRARALTLMHAQDPLQQSMVDWNDDEMNRPFIFHGEYGSSDNAFVDDLLQQYLTRWSNVLACWNTWMGRGRTEYYPGVHQEFAQLAQEVVAGCSGYSSLLSAPWWLQAGRFWSFMIRPDWFMARTGGRWNSANGNPMAYFSYHANRTGWPYLRSLAASYVTQNAEGDQLGWLVPTITYQPAAWHQSTTGIARSWSDTTSGCYFWRSGWNNGLASTDVHLWFACGPGYNPDNERNVNIFDLSRGHDVLVTSAGKYNSQSDDPWYQTYCPSTICRNAVLVDLAGEVMGGSVPTDGGQTREIMTTGSRQSHWPLCDLAGSYGGFAGWSDTLIADASLELGVIGHADSVYSTAKASRITRSIRVPATSDLASGHSWLLIQDVVPLVGTRDTRVVFHCIDRPTADGTWSTLDGSAYGGLYESDGATYQSVTSGASEAVIYRAYGSGSPKWRLVGGASPSNLIWRSNWASACAFLYVANAADQAWENRIGSINYVPTYTGGSESCTQTGINNRNRMPSQWPDNSCDWRMESYWPSATDTVRAVHLIEVGAAAAIAPRTLTSSILDAGVQITMTGSQAITIWEPLLTPDGYAHGSGNLTLTVSAAGDVFVYGQPAGTYSVAKDGVVEITSLQAPNGNMVFPATAAGTWSIAKEGGPALGACCDPDGSCTMTTSEGCSGAWQGYPSACDPNPCPQPPPVARCCYPDGTCAIVTEAICTAAGGTWEVGEDCEAACPQPLGACCCVNGACHVRVQASCSDPCGGSANVASWTMFGVCTPNPCPQPPGRCCYESGACAVMLEADCVAAGGTWFYSATPSCSPNTCTQPQSACCYEDGSCLMKRPSLCASSGGTPLGWPTVCDPNPCPTPPPVGSCCYTDGTCVETIQDECTATWTESGVCDPNTCEQPRGACCATEGTCTYTQQFECEATWMGIGTVCDPNPCPQPMGSCCAPNGTCTVTLEVDCSAVWTMFGGCDLNVCDQPEGACCAADGSCTVALEAACAGAWLGFGTICSPNPCPQPVATGACCFPDGSCLITVETACGGEWHGDWGCTPNPCPKAVWWRPQSPWDFWSPWSWGD
jgi:hypothetical protein